MTENMFEEEMRYLEEALDNGDISYSEFLKEAQELESHFFKE